MAIALANPPIIPGMPLTLCTPKVSKIPHFFSNHPDKYFIPNTQTVPEIAPKIMHPAGLTNNPVQEPAPMLPQREPLNRSITENLSFKNMLRANETITLEHIDKIVFIITIDFSKGDCVRYWLLMEGAKQKIKKHPKYEKIIVS